MSELKLPPIFTPMGFIAEANLPGEALYRATRKRMDPGTVCYSERLDRLDAIIMLAPETPLRQAVQVVYPLMLAANDALGAVMPPGVAVHMGWPDRLFVNGALVGGIGLFTQQDDLDAVPDWMLARISVNIMGDPQNPFPGEVRDRTSLYDEGGGNASALVLLESFCRYFLNWLDTWQRGGVPALKQNWLERAAGRTEDANFPNDGTLVRGRVGDVVESGDLIVQSEGREQTLILTGLLAGPSWEL